MKRRSGMLRRTSGLASLIGRGKSRRDETCCFGPNTIFFVSSTEFGSQRPTEKPVRLVKRANSRHTLAVTTCSLSLLLLLLLGSVSAASASVARKHVECVAAYCCSPPMIVRGCQQCSSFIGSSAVSIGTLGTLHWRDAHRTWLAARSYVGPMGFLLRDSMSSTCTLVCKANARVEQEHAGLKLAFQRIERMRSAFTRAEKQEAPKGDSTPIQDSLTVGGISL